MRFKLETKFLLIFIIILIINISLIIIPNVSSAAVLYDNSYIGSSYDLTAASSSGYGLYSVFPFWSGTGPLFSGYSGVTLSADARFLRVKRLSGVNCNIPSNILVARDNGYVLSWGGTGSTSGSFCDFPLTGSTSGQKLGAVFICIYGGCTGSQGTMILDGSSANAGYTVDGTQTVFQKGGYAFQICDNGGCSGGFNTPSNYYARIKNTTSGIINFRNGPSTSSNITKTLPEDWILHVDNTIDGSGNPVTANGYNWYQVTDPTDNVSGWMIGSDASNTVYYLPYDINQSSLQSISSDQINTSSRPSVILDAINHYYNNTSTATSLFSSDDGPIGYKISQLKNGGYPEKLIWGITAREDGGTIFNFDNENISFDYGHGVMQITFSPSFPFDNRGISSNITIPPCALDSSLFNNCYTSADNISPYLRHYKPYADNSSNPTYKQYSNTSQSIYANIKDGLYILAHNYDAFDYINTSATVGGITYSADERKDILATQYYNGGNDDACSYVDDVATALDNIDSYFSDTTASDISTLIDKMHSAGSSIICANLHSPGDLSIEDTSGKIIGVENGRAKNDFPLAVYDKSKKYIVILAAENNNYTYKVIGTGSGTYGLDITIKSDDKETTFKATDIPILKGQIHSYTVNKKALIEGKNGVALKIDRKGNGIIDRIIETGSLLTGVTYNKGATPEELKASLIGDINSTVYLHQNKTVTPEGLPYPKFKQEAINQSREADKDSPAFMKDSNYNLNMLNKKNE